MLSLPNHKSLLYLKLLMLPFMKHRFWNHGLDIQKISFDAEIANSNGMNTFLANVVSTCLANDKSTLNNAQEVYQGIHQI